MIAEKWNRKLKYWYISSIFPNVFPLVNDALWPAFCTTAASVLQWAEVWLTASVSSSLSTTVTLWHMARTVEFIAFSPLWWINVTKSRDDNNVSVATTPAPCQSPGFLPVFSKPTATPLILKSEMLYGSLGAHLTIPTLTTTHFTRYKKIKREKMCLLGKSWCSYCTHAYVLYEPTQTLRRYPS